MSMCVRNRLVMVGSIGAGNAGCGTNMGRDRKFTKDELKQLREDNPHMELVDDDEALAHFNEERERQERELRGEN